MSDDDCGMSYCYGRKSQWYWGMGSKALDRCYGMDRVEVEGLSCDIFYVFSSRRLRR